MFRAIRKVIIKRRLLAHAEAEQRLDDLCRPMAQAVTQYYGFRGMRYDVLSEVEQLCVRLDNNTTTR